MATGPAEATSGEIASEVTILSRLLLNSQGGGTPEFSRYLLSLEFSNADKARMHELAVKNQAGKISPQDLRELDGYVKAGALLAILQANARMAVKKNRR
jgi:hypothetical protein